MSARLQWKSAASGKEGVFIVRNRALELTVFADGHLDRAEDASELEPGLQISVPDADGKLLVTARNGLLLESGGRSFERVKLPPGGSVNYQVDGAGGELTAAGASTSGDPLVGRELGGYQVLARLGNGAMGVVYRAKQLKLDREVALKVLDPKAAKSPMAVASFKREAVAAGRLSHPNLLQVYDVGSEQGLQFFAMELVVGGDLEDRLKESGPLPWEEAVHYIADAALALDFAREHHLVHRDVKPENLMLTVDGRVKLADLGMATTRGMVEGDSAGGTPHFLAPEAVSGTADHRSDLYSLGCSLYRLLTGRTPYSGTAVKEILRSHRDSDIPSAREYAADVPVLVDDLIAWMMAKDPADRPQLASEVVEACEEALHGGKSRNTLFGLIAVAVIAIGAAVYFATQKDPEQGDPEKIIVEVGGEEAAAERLRAEAAERESDFLRALTKPEGEQRIAALQQYIAEYPDGERVADAQAEIQRLQALPENPNPGADLNGVGNGSDSEMGAALTALEAAVAADLKSGAYGSAHARLGTSELPAVLLVPLLGGLKEATDTAFEAWESNHAAALAAQDWSAAENAVQEFGASFAEADVPTAWTQRRDALEIAGSSAQVAAAEAAFRDARTAVLEGLQQQVLPAVLHFDFAAAEQQLTAIAAACPHTELRAVLEARIPLFTSAARASDAMLAGLDGSGDLSIVEPAEGRRAFVLSSNADGLRVRVQERGERVERTVPWNEFSNPTALQALFDGLAPTTMAVSDRLALTTVYASACVVSRMQNWQLLPTPIEASALSESTLKWLEAIPTAELASTDGALSEERFQLVLFESFFAALAAEDAYLALQRAREAGARFGLLTAWISDGDSSWQFQP